MGRLIDADELLARIILNYNNHQNVTAGAIKDIINTTRTAYDKDKVVEDLEKSKEKGYAELTMLEVNELMDRAIDIVKRGGVE